MSDLAEKVAHKKSKNVKMQPHGYKSSKRESDKLEAIT